jgi:hypothetical protein
MAENGKCNRKGTEVLGVLGRLRCKHRHIRIRVAERGPFVFPAISR